MLGYMEGLLASFKPLWKRLRKYRVEILLIGLAFIITLISLALFVRDASSGDEKAYEDDEEMIISPPSSPTKVVVDLAGAVHKPGLYEASNGARLQDVLLMAGGLSEEAHRDYFSRNFNLAKLISDQEKIYIPSVFEINNGIFEESLKNPGYSSGYSVPSESIQTININAASADELDTLPGVGKITADKIIKGRPYSLIEELLTKKIINKTIYQNIRDRISM